MSSSSRRLIERGALAALALLVGVTVAPHAAAQSTSTAAEPIATAPVTIEGVALRHVLDAPVPLYVTSSISDEKVRWMRDAMAIALVEVPRITGLPLPQQRIEFYLFTDPREMSSLSGQLLRSPGPRAAPECFALAANNTPRRGIYCQADTWDSSSQALDYVVHELTHQVEQGDSVLRRDLAQWYNEGLAEHVQLLVTSQHRPGYAARDRWQREARVASALHTDRLPRLRDLTTNQRWQQTAGSGYAGLIYSHSSLVVGWLADQYGLEAVVEVVRRSGSPVRFDAAFEEVFGLTVERAESASRAAFEADLLARYPKGISVFRDGDASDAAVHFAAVGFRPREWLTKEYRYENGVPADGVAATGTRPESERADLSGFATWSWTRRGAVPAGLAPRVELVVRGSEGTEASESAILPAVP